MNSNAEAILAGLVRVGTVSSVDASKHRARVIFPDKNMVSGWLFVLQMNGANVNTESSDGHAHSGSVKYWMPKVHDSVLCLYLPLFNGDGFVIGGIP